MGRHAKLVNGLSKLKKDILIAILLHKSVLSGVQISENLKSYLENLIEFCEKLSTEATAVNTYFSTSILLMPIYFSTVYKHLQLHE